MRTLHEYQIPSTVFFLLAILFMSVWTTFLQAQTTFEFNLTWEQNVFPNNPYTIVFDQLDRPYFYVANDNGGVRIFLNEKDSDPVQVTQVLTTNWDTLKVMDLTQSGHFLYMALGTFFNANPRKFGLAIIDIENPEAPIVKDYWIHPIPKKGSAIIRVDGNYAFLGAMNAGLFIFDISNPDAIVSVSDYLPDPDFPIPDPNEIQEPNARGLAIREDLVFLCYDAGGISVIDISDINVPTEIHRYINTDFVDSTQQAYNNIILHENYGYIATDFCGLEIVDISNPENIQQVGIWNPWGCETANNFWLNSLGHTNQLAFLPGKEGTILIMSGNDTEMIALDVSDPVEIELLDSFGETEDNIRTWGMGISENEIAAAYYFTLLPWVSGEAKIKLFNWNLSTTIQNFASERFEVFPNPTSGKLIIANSNPVNNYLEIKIFNSWGQLLLNENLHAVKEVELDIQSLNFEGLLYIQILSGQSQLLKKVIMAK